ncbi:MAG: hypothetical protein NVSMB13_07410 [Mycobacteriales bacterium]
MLGLALGAGYLFQTFGMERTSAAVSGLMTGLFVVLTPLGAAVLLRQPPSRGAWAAVGLATAGLGLLALHGFALGAGEGPEPVFAGIFAVALGGERPGWRLAVGGVVVLAAMLLVEVGPRAGAEGRVERLEVEPGLSRGE